MDIQTILATVAILVIFLTVGYFVIKNIKPNKPITVFFPEANNVFEIKSIFDNIGLAPFLTIVEDVTMASLIIHTKNNAEKVEHVFGEQIEIFVPLRDGILTDEHVDEFVKLLNVIFMFLPLKKFILSREKKES